MGTQPTSSAPSLRRPVSIAAAVLLIALYACDLPAGAAPAAVATPTAESGFLTAQALDALATQLSQTEQALATQAAQPTAPPPPTEAPPPTAPPAPTASPVPIPTSPPVEPGADAYEPDDTPEQASLIVPGDDPQLHNFGQASDEDWIAFDGEAGARYLIRTLDLGAESDTFIELFDAGGNSLGYDDDGAGTIFGPSVLIFSCGQDGRYFVKVRNWFHGNIGAGATYSIQVTLR